VTKKHAPWADLDALLPDTVNGQEKPPFPGPPAFSSWTYQPHHHVEVVPAAPVEIEPGGVWTLPAGTHIQYLHVPSWVQPQRVTPGPYPWLSPEGDVRCGAWEVNDADWDVAARASLTEVAHLGVFTTVMELPVDRPVVIVRVKLGASS